MKKRVGVARFPGTNCDQDVWGAIESVGHEPHWLWHKDSFDYRRLEALVVPGGFSYGDYLRSGALAARSRVMQSIKEAASKGWPVLGICNGFQILCEAGLLPGALVKNQGQRFVDRWVRLKRETDQAQNFWPLNLEVSLPVAHGDGRYLISEAEINVLEDKNQIWLRYADNPNGSVSDIAGVCNQEGNICALMPHPERAMENWMGGRDGRSVFEGRVK